MALCRLRQKEETQRVESRAAYSLCSCVRMEKAGQTDVRPLSGLSETKIFGDAIQDSGSRLKGKVLVGSWGREG